MRKVILVTMVVMVLLTIPLEIEEDIELEKLEQDIAKVPYSPSDYRRGTFDCSNMAMWLGKELEKEGYIVVIEAGTAWEKDNSLVGHMWIIVDGVVLVEPTQKKIVQDPGWYYKKFFPVETFWGTEQLWNHYIQKYGVETAVLELSVPKGTDFGRNSHSTDKLGEPK